MSSSPASPTRRTKSRGHRVAFDTSLAEASKKPAFFTNLAAASSRTLPGHNPVQHPVQNKLTAASSSSSASSASRYSHHMHNSSHRGSNKPHLDRRTRVEDVDDEDDIDHSHGHSHSSRHRAASKSGRARTATETSSRPTTPGIPLGGPVLDPTLPSTTASAAAGGFAEPGPGGVPGVPGSAVPGVPGIPGVPGYNGINPATGANGVYTHLNNGYNIQAFPTFLPAANMAAAQGYPYAAGATHAVNGIDPTAITGISFLPAVPDATNGPMVHTYVPRNDAPGQNIVYVQQPGQQQAVYTTANGVPVQIATTTAPMMAYPQGTMGQPIYVQQQPGVTYAVGAGGVGGIGSPPVVMMSGGVPGGNYFVGGGCGGIGGIGGGGGGFGGGGGLGIGAGGIHPEPAMGIGQTPSEVLQEQLEFAYANNLYEPQDFKPADDDKSRFYWLRELDGNWTQRSRATIDHLGCRWYITDGGVFYAVRLPD